MNYLKTPWTSQPQQAVEIDWSNPITRGLLDAWLPQSLPYRSANGRRPTVTGAINLAVGSLGVGAFAASSSIRYDVGAFGQSGTFCTVSIAEFRSYGATTSVVRRDGATTPLQVGASTLRGVGWNPLNSTAYYFSAPSSARAGVFVANRESQSTEKLYFNGVLGATSSSYTGYGSTSNPLCFLGNESNGELLTSSIGLFYGAITWTRALSEAEIRSISQNPWQIFKPIPRRIFAPVVAGGSDTLLYPTKGSLVTSGYVPTITQPGSNTTLSPAKGSLALTGKTPTLTQPNALSPSKASAIFSGKQPTISQTANQTLSPSKVSLVFSGKTPTIDQTAANSILPGTGHCYTTGKTPTITQPNSLAPSKSAVSLTGYQPTVLQSFSINPTTGAVVITGKTPSITQPNAITPLVAHAILTGKTPIISDSTPMTDSQKLDLIIDILSNKQTLNPTTGIYTLYADDGVTPIYTAAAYEDAAGTVPYRGQALQRLDSLQEI